jgi:hypothetical protein
MFNALGRWQHRFTSPAITSTLVSRGRVACSINGLSALINHIKLHHTARNNRAVNQRAMLTGWNWPIGSAYVIDALPAGTLLRL